MALLRGVRHVWNHGTCLAVLVFPIRRKEVVGCPVRRKEVVSVSGPHDDYIPVGDGQPQDAASSEHFILQSLLSSRVDTGLCDENLPGEEDVNLYLTHLVCGWIDPRRQVHHTTYVRAFDHETFEQVQHSTNSRLKYTVYRANADYLLMLLGIFDNARAKRPVAHELQLPRQSYMGRAQTYYDFASTYSRLVFGKDSAVPNVLCKLANNFHDYVRLLTHLRSEYLNLISHLSDGVLYHLQEDVTAQMVSVSYDGFLDALAEWRDNPTVETRDNLIRIAEQLQRIDADFRWEIPE